jgi:NitT/TauT family transport system substrate-binding protein
MAEAFRNDAIQAAMIIAPLAVVLKQQGVDIQVVYIGNRHESTLVVRKALGIATIEALAGKTVAVPMRYSGHHLLMLKALAQKGLSDNVRMVEMNPPDMASALTSGALDAYFVGEPFAAQTLKSGDAVRLCYAEEMWPGFICNLMIVKRRFIEKAPDLVRRLVRGAARTGFWARSHVDQASAIVCGYWHQPAELVTYALSTPEGRICYDQFVPKIAELQEIADLMVRFGLAETTDVSGLVNDQFAREVIQTDVPSLQHIFE